MARVGIEASSDFAIDVGVQLVSSGFDLNEIKWGDALFNAGLGILSVRATGHAGKRMGNGAKGGIIHHSKLLFKRAKENIVAVHNKVAVPFNKGVKKVGKNTFEFLNNVAKNIAPHNRLEFCTGGINVNEFKGSNPFDKFDIGVFKGKILRFFKGSDGGSFERRVKTGADDIYSFQKYRQSLIADDVLSNSDVIIEGGKLRDDKAIKALTSDGSAIDDWAKMSSKYSYDTLYGRGQYHYYQNLKTGEINPFDIKLKLNKEPHYVIPMDSNFNPIK